MIGLSVLDSSLFHNGIKSVSIKTETNRLFLSMDSSSSWSIIHKSEFSENLTRLVILKEFRFSISFEFLSTFKSSTKDNKELLSIITLIDDRVSILESSDFHRINDNLQSFSFKIIKHETFL